MADYPALAVRSPNVSANFLAGAQAAGQMQDSALKNYLNVQKAQAEAATTERDALYRNLLGEYLGGGQSPELLNQLFQMDPERTNQFVAAQQEQQQFTDEQAQRGAQEIVQRMEFVLQSENPARALRLAGRFSDGSDLMEWMQQEGLIDTSDGIDDDEARQIAQHLIMEQQPLLAPSADRADPASIREMERLGYEMTPEGFAQYNADKAERGSDALGELSARLAIMEREDRIARERREEEVATEERRRQAATQRNAINRALGQTEKIADLTEKLEGTLLEAGVPLADWRRSGASLLASLGSAVGADTKKLRSEIDAYDQLKKNLSDQLINLMSTGGLGEATNSKLEQYRNALASTETSPGAIMAIQASIAETLLDEADVAGHEVKDREKIEATIERLRGYSTPGGEAVIDVPAIMRMAREQLQNLDPSQMSDEAIEAAARRWDELNAGR